MTSPGLDRSVSISARAAFLGHRGGVVWLTGLPGSGKSTLASGLEQRLFAARVLSVVIDGDILRTGLCIGLGYSNEDRKENIRRAGESALLLAEAGAVAVVALISPFREDRARIAARTRALGFRFVEVYVNAPLAECERRDPKSLYKKARAGMISAFTGIDSPYEAPTEPDLELQTDRESPEQSLEKLTAATLTVFRPTAGT